jgi:hypothetical protein
MGAMQEQLAALRGQLGLLGAATEGAEGVQPTIRDQLAEIAGALQGMTGQDGESLHTLYDMSEVQISSIKEMQNKVEQIRQAAEVTRRIAEEGRQKVQVQTWFELGSVILKILVVNPTDEEQTVPVKAYLPKEVREQHVIDQGNLDLMYDSEKGAYYVTSTAALKPKESAVYAIEVEDIWSIPQDRLTSISEGAVSSARQLQGSEYEDKATLLANQIDLKLAQIWQRQSDPALTPEQHIRVYRENLETVVQLEADLALLKRMMESVLEPGGQSPEGDFLTRALSDVSTNWGDAGGGSLGRSYSPSTAMTWRVIFGLLAFLGLLSLMAFLLWQHQAQMAMKAEVIALEHGAESSLLGTRDPGSGGFPKAQEPGAKAS